MKWVLGLGVLFLLVVAWAAFIRPWMRTQPWAQGFFATIEPVERAVYLKSETLIVARFLAGLGVLISGLIQIGSIDLSPIAPFLPDGYRWVPTVLPLFVSLLGVIQEWLRRDTTKPLAIVAMRTDAPESVKAAAADAAAVNKEAEAAVIESEANK